MEGYNVNKRAPPQADKVMINPSAMMYMVVRSAFQMLAQAMTTEAQALTNQSQKVKTQVNKNVGTYVNPNVNLDALRVRDFARMNPPEFPGFKVDQDLQRFIDEVYKVLDIMGASPIDKVELDTYQLKMCLKFGMNSGKVKVPQE